MPAWKKMVLHGSSGSLAHLKLENLTSQSVLGTDASGNVVAGSVSGYSLPTATSLVLGGIKVGGTLAISSGILNARTYIGASEAAFGEGEGGGAAGVAGYVPAASASQYLSFLRGDGTWQTPTNTVTRLRQSAGTLVAGDFTFAGSGATTVSYSGGTFTISSTDTDTNTTYSAGTGLTLTGTTFSVTTNTYAAAAHSHAIRDITDLQTALDGKQVAGSYAASSHTHDDRYLKLTETSSFFDRIIDAAPGTLDTLNELAAAIGDDANFSASIARVIAGKADSSHTHAISAITGLQTALDGKQASLGFTPYNATNPSGYITSYVDTVTSVGISGDLSTGNVEFRGSGATTISKSGGTITISSTDTDTNTTYSAGTGLTLTGTTFSVTSGTYAAASHTHSIGNVTGLQTALDGKQASGDYSVSGHTHSIRDVTDLQTTLDGKQASLGFTPYNATNPSGFITGYTETDTLNSVTGRGASTANNITLSGGGNTFNGHHYFSAYDANGNHYPHYNAGSSANGSKLNLRMFDSSGTVVLFHLNGNSKAIEWNGYSIWHAGSLTNLNQLSNGPGYITSYVNTVTSVGVSGDLSTGDVDFRGGGATTISKSGGTITISSTDTDTNTTYTAGTGLTLTGTTFSVTAGTYAASSHTHTIGNVTGLQTALDEKLGTSGKAADSETVDGVDSSRIIFGDGARGSTYVSSMDDPNQKSGFFFKDNPTGQPFGDWWNWLTVAGNSWQSSNNYSFQIGHAFHSDDAYIRRMTNGTAYSWRTLITSGNIGSQSVNYASSAGAVAWDNVSSKPTTFAPSSHTHTIGNVTGLQTALDGKQASGDYSVSGHTHAIRDITDLQTTLDGKQASLGFTPYNATNPSGFITSTSNISGNAATATNASTVGGITPIQFFNNMGDDHGTRTSFDASTPSYSFGFRFIQGNTNGPALGGGGQFYSWYLGLGNNYPATGAGSYGMHVAVPRSATTPYMSVRYNENNNLGSWIKIAAGYADSAGAVAWDNVSSKPTTFTPSSHTHTIGNVTGLQTALDGKQASGDYSVSGHTHAIRDITDLQTTLDGKQASGNYAASSHTHDDRYYTETESDDRFLRIAVNSSSPTNATFAIGTASDRNFIQSHSSRPLDINPLGNTVTIGGNTAIHTGNYSSYALPLSGGTVTGIAYFQTNNGAKSGATDSAKLQAYSTGNNSAFMSFHKSGNYAVNFGLDDDNVMRLGGWSAAANRMQLDMSGNVTFAGNVTGYSDARIKTNVKTIDNALEKVKSLRGVSFTRTDSDDRSTNIGVIAQEVLDILPEVVSQDASGMYNVAYGNMAGLFIEAIKQQQSLIEQQQKQIDQLKALVDGLTK